MKRFVVITVIAGIFVYISGCQKSGPAEVEVKQTVVVIASHTNSPTITLTHTVSPTYTITRTVTPTNSDTPTSTITPTSTETPFVFDDFEDGDYVNNIDPPLNMWHTFDTAVHVNLEAGGPPGSSYYLRVSGSVSTDLDMGVCQTPLIHCYYKTKKLPVGTLNISGNPLDLTGFTHISFDMKGFIETQPADPVFLNKPQLVMQDVNDVLDSWGSIMVPNPASWTKYCIPLTQFNTSDLSQIKSFWIYIYVGATGCQSCVYYYDISIDNIEFCNGCTGIGG